MPGALGVALGIVLLVYGLIDAPNQGWGTPRTLLLFGSGIALLAAFVVWQGRARQPLVDLRLFRDARFSGGAIAMVLPMFVMYGFLFTLPLYLQGVRGFDALGTGLRLIPMMAGILLAAGVSKKVLTRIGARTGVVAGLVLSAAALAALSRLGVDTSMVWLGAGLAVFGLGLGVAMTSAMDAVLGSVLASLYTESLDAGLLGQFPGDTVQTVKGSIIGATMVADTLGAKGDALRHMARVAYTVAMAVVLVSSAVVGVVAAAICAVVMPGRSTAGDEREDEPVIQQVSGAAPAQE